MFVPINTWGHYIAREELSDTERGSGGYGSTGK